MKLTLTSVLALATAVSAFPFPSSLLGKRQDLGSCRPPNIIFATGLDGRKEASFQASNLS